jgi:integrase
VKAAKPYPYLYKDIDRQGHVRWRLRAPRKPTVTIKGEYGSPEFAANYRAAMECQPRASVVARAHGTFGALACSYLRSAEFSQLANETKRQRRSLIEQFCLSYGELPVASLERRHVKKMMDGLSNTPGTARKFLSMLRVLMALAVEDGIRDDNPTLTIKRPKLSRGGWHSWEDAEIAQYEAKHPIGSQARLSLALAIYTGQRASDLIVMGRQHVDGDKINVVQRKTGTRLWIQIDPRLKAIIDATPSPHLTFLISAHGRPYASPKTFGAAMGNWAKEAGLNGCPLHGLRKACCRRLAEAGCSASEIMSVSGHKSLVEVERYVRAANQKRMAEAAIEKVSGTQSYPRRGQSYPREKKA